MKKELKSVMEIATMFHVTKVSVYNWIESGLKHETKKVIGRRRMIVIDPDDVKKFHGI